MKPEVKFYYEYSKFDKFLKEAKGIKDITTFKDLKKYIEKNKPSLMDSLKIACETISESADILINAFETPKGILVDYTIVYPYSSDESHCSFHISEDEVAIRPRVEY